MQYDPSLKGQRVLTTKDRASHMQEGFGIAVKKIIERGKVQFSRASQKKGNELEKRKRKPEKDGCHPEFQARKKERGVGLTYRVERKGSRVKNMKKKGQRVAGIQVE